MIADDKSSDSLIWLISKMALAPDQWWPKLFWRTCNISWCDMSGAMTSWCPKVHGDHLPESKLHLPDTIGLVKRGFRGLDDLRDSDTWGDLEQRGAAVRKADDRHLGDHQVHRSDRRQRQNASFHDLRFTFGRMLHGDDHSFRAGDEVHGAAHSRHHLARDHPVGEAPLRVDLQTTEHCHTEMAAADEREGHGAVERAGSGQSSYRAATSIGQRWVRHALFRNWTRTNQSILGLKEYTDPFGHVVCHEGRNSDAEIDKHSRAQFARDALGDDGLRVHGALPIGDEIIDDSRRRDHMIGCNHAHRHDMIQGCNDRTPGHRNHRIEIAGGKRVGEITDVIGEKCMDEREVGLQCGLEQIALSVDINLALPLLDNGANSSGSEDAA